MQKGIESDIKELASKSVLQQKLISRGTQVTSGTLACVDVVLMGVIAYLVANGNLQLTDYISLTQYVMLVYTPLTIFQSFKIVTKPALVSLDRINEMLNQEKFESTDGVEIKNINKIEIKNLNFNYSGRANAVLEKVNLKMEKGERLSLVGRNGCGKTTLIKLLMGYYEINCGTIFYNDIDINAITRKSIRMQIGLIPQNVFLFNASIYENIRVGNTEMSILNFEDRLNLILKYGFLKDADLTKVVEDNGKNLSKGQIQQVAIARILVKKHSVYIFDEATSYLDKKARESLYEYIQNEVKQGICIFISHHDEFEYLVNKKLCLDNNS